ncbi:MAG TPA: translocation/assembly module TamB domain-containing protein [Polyangiaceae bacterium]
MNELTAQANVPDILHKILFGVGTVTLRIEHARAEKAEAYVMSGKTEIPTIADAFTPLPSKTPSAPHAPSTRKIKVWLPSIEVGQIYGRVSIGSVPTLEAELHSVHGAVSAGPDLTSVDVERFAMIARGLGGADAHGVGIVHVRVPGDVWTSFDGYFGDMQLGAVVRVNSPELQITVDVPRAEPAQARALWQGYPLQKDVGAHVEAKGTVHSLHTQAKVLVGRGSIDANGEVRLSGDPGVDLDLSGRGLNLQALWPVVPETRIDADATLSVFQSNQDLLADINGSTHETKILGVPVPAIDVNGTYSSKGFDGHATLHEPGMPVKATVDVRPDGSVDISAETNQVDLARAPRIKPHFSGQGLADLKLKAHIEKNRLDAHIDAELRDFALGPVTIKSSTVSGRASGPLDAPNQLNLDLSAKSQMFRLGTIGFDELETKAKGPLTRPQVSAVVHNQYGPSISARATVATRGPELSDLTLELERDQAKLTATVAKVTITGDQVRVNDLSVQGAGGRLDASGELGPEHLALVAQGQGLDLETIAHALGLPRGVLGGKIALDADLDSTKKTQRGSLIVKLDQGQIDGVAIDSASLSTQLVSSHLDLQASAKTRDFGNFVAEARTTVQGSLGDVETLTHATGRVNVTAEHMPLGLLSYVLPKSAGVAEMRGEASASLELNREQPSAIPSVALLVNTSGLHVALNPTTKSEAPPIFDGVDVHAGLNVNGDSGQSEATLKLEDRHGQLLSASSSLTLDLESALKHPEQLFAQLRSTPLVAKAVIEDRPLEDLPAPIVPTGIAGRLRTEASLRGTLDRPIFSDKTELYQLRFGESQRDKAIDLCAQLDYDKNTGQYGARGELFLPSNSPRACKGSRVAQFSGAGKAAWDKITSSGPTVDTAWTGTIGVSLEGFPLDVVPQLAESGIEGKVLGAVMFDRRQTLPQMVAHLEVRDTVVARTRIGTVKLDTRTDGRALSAQLNVDETLGKLDSELQTSLNWQGVLPSIDETQPLALKLTASDVDAVILSPVLRDVLSEVGGKLDAKLAATFSANADPKAEQHWTGAVNGTLDMRHGTLQLAQLGLRMKDVSFNATADGKNGNTTIQIASLSAAAEAEKPNVTARGKITLDGFRLTTGHADAELHQVPLLVEGVTFATLDGKKIAVDLERRPTEMFVALKVPELSATLPTSGTRTLIALGNNSDIEIGQPIAEPRKAADGEALPWRMKFDLGNKVKLTRTDLFLPLTGSPEILLGSELKVGGNIELIPGGRLNLPGLPRPFTIESGTVSFDEDGDPGDPRVAVQAICEAQQVTVRAKVSGTLNKAKVDLEDVDDPSVTDPAVILAKLLNAPTDENTAASSSNPASAGLGAGAGLLGSQLLANTALSNLQIKTGSETTADQRLYQTYSAAYPISDTIWFEGSYKTSQDPVPTGANTAFSGTIDYRFRRNWSLRTEVGNIGAGVDLLWQYKY